MSGNALQCDTCGTIVQDPAAESCPRCRATLGAPTARVAAESWENIDGGWDDLDTEMHSPTRPPDPRSPELPRDAPARTLVGMGIPDAAAGLDAPETDPEGVVAMTQPMPTWDDEPVQSGRPAAPRTPPEQLSGPVPVALPHSDPTSLPTMPIERLPSSERRVEPLPPTASRRRGSGAGLPTLPPEGMPSFRKGLPTLQAPRPALDLSPDEQRVAPDPEGSSPPSPVEGSFAVAAFDDVSTRSDYDAEASSVERPSEAKTLPPVRAGQLEQLEQTATQKRPAPEAPTLPGAPKDERGSAAFADTTLDVPAHPPMERQGVSVGLIALWIVAIAAVVAAALVLVLR